MVTTVTKTDCKFATRSHWRGGTYVGFHANCPLQLYNFNQNCKCIDIF